ncbi:MAG: hypothetical protein HQM07_09295, partial [Zetaproteobacteria bacterium]|nr:hypothetical protein [Zetaproteobacteria bacterium]
MAMTVQTNMNTMGVLRNIQNSETQANKQLEALSSGYKINSAADDPAGFAISLRLEGSKQKYVAAQENVLSATALTKTADAGLNRINDIVKDLQSLATRAASGQNSSSELNNLNDLAKNLLQNVDQIANGTQFNGQPLLNSNAAPTIQIGQSGAATDQLAINLSDNTAQALGISGIDLSTQAGAQAALNSLDQAAATLTNNQASLGASNNEL